MPLRLLREGILTSDRVDKLAAAEEVFYRRLMSVVDDFGRFDGRPAILRSSLYPLRIERVREADIVRSLACCQEAGLIRLYTVASKPYLEILDFRQQVRAKASKYPDPEDADPPPSSCAASAKQLLADAHLDVNGDGDVNGDDPPIAPKGAERAEKVLPERWKNIPRQDLKTHKVLCNNRLMKRIGSWFGRKSETLWNLAEGVALMKLAPDPADVELLESWYLAENVGDRDIRRRDLMTLLNNWSIDLDRARIWKTENP